MLDSFIYLYAIAATIGLYVLWIRLKMAVTPSPSPTVVIAQPPSTGELHAQRIMARIRAKEAIKRLDNGF